MSGSGYLNTPEKQKPESPTQNAEVTSLREAIMGFRTTQLISVAARLNIAEYLKDGSQTPEQLSKIINAHPNSLGRLLRALSSLGIFEQKDDGSFGNTPTAELLRDAIPGSLRSLAVLYGADWLWQAYAGLPYSVETGMPAFDHVHGSSLYAYLEQHPKAGFVFHKAMSGYSDGEATSIIHAYDFSAARAVVDIGGGQGAFVSALLKVNPHLTGTVFDLPAVIETVSSDLTSAARETGISYASGDFFKEVPGGGDVYFLKSVLHNWDDASCIQILRNCRKVMKESARLLITERVIPVGSGKSEAKLFDINMLVVTGGRERTGEEYGKLFNEAGFDLTRIISTGAPVNIIEGLPAS